MLTLVLQQRDYAILSIAAMIGIVALLVWPVIHLWPKVFKFHWPVLELPTWPRWAELVTPLTVAAIALGLGLRLQWWLNAQPFWFDETFTARLAGLPFERLIAATAGDVHPPLFYLLEWLIARLLPITPLSMRLLPTLFSALAFWPAWQLSDRAGLSPTARLIGLSLLAVSNYHLVHADEARMYPLMLFLTLAGAVAAFDGRALRLFVIFTALLYTNNYGAFYCAAIGLMALWRTRHWRILAAGAGALLLFTPWLIVLSRQMSVFSSGHWIWPPTFGDLLGAHFAFLFAEFAQPPVTLAALTLAVLLVGMVLLWLANDGRAAPLLWLWLAPLVITVAVSHLWRPVYLPRALTGVTVPFFLLIGHLLTRSRALWRGALALALIAITALTLPIRPTALTRFHPAEMAQAILANWQPGDVIYHYSLGPRMELNQFVGERPQVLLPAKSAGLDIGGYSAPTRAALGLDERPLSDVAFTRAWLVMATDNMDDYARERAALAEDLAHFPHQLAGRWNMIQGQLTFESEVYLLWQSPTPQP